MTIKNRLNRYLAIAAFALTLAIPAFANFDVSAVEMPVVASEGSNGAGSGC